jgi:hypothetical protein
VDDLWDTADELPPPPPRGFSLATFMLFVTMVSIVLGMLLTAPALGVPLAFFAIAAWGRTSAINRQRWLLARRPFSAAHHVVLYCESLVVTSFTFFLFVGAFIIVAMSYARVVANVADFLLGTNASRLESLIAILLYAVILAAACGVIWTSVLFNRWAWKYHTE